MINCFFCALKRIKSIIFHRKAITKFGGYIVEEVKKFSFYKITLNIYYSL